jgi:hypothetical protein
MYQAQWKTWPEKYLCLTRESQGLEKQYNKKKMRAAVAAVAVAVNYQKH